MKNLKDILTTLNSHKKRLFKEYTIKSLAVFGSYSREDYHENSDVDLLVEFDDQIGVKFIDLAEELEKLIGSKVDLVSKRGIKEKYLKAINSELIYV